MQAGPHTTVDCDGKVTQDAKVHTTLLRFKIDWNRHMLCNILEMHAAIGLRELCIWATCLQNRPADEAAVWSRGSTEFQVHK